MDVLDDIWDLIESVSEGFSTYSSIILNKRLSRRENLVLVLTQKSKIRLQNIVEKTRNCS